MRALILAILVGVSPLALAEEEHPAAEAGEHKAEAGEHHAAHHEEAGIVNWWSWDYGATAKDPAHKGWPPPFGFAFINFAVFLFVMSKLLFKPLRAMASERHHSIARQLDEAQKLHAAAEAKLKEYGDRVARADEEILTLVAKIREESEADKARIIAAAEADAARLKAEAHKQIQAELARLKEDIRRQVVDKVAAVAEALVAKQFSADDQRKLIDRYVADLEKTQGAKS